MKIACITVTTNEFHLLDSWKSYYDIYKDEIDLHIIVDNASSDEYKNLLHKSFPDSVILEQTINGGVTVAYNEGIRYAFGKNDIDLILLVCPDVKFESGSLSVMKNTFMNRPEVGIAGPLMINNEDNNPILGARLSKYLEPRFNIPRDLNEYPDEFEVDFISGGINMIRREVYEKIGFQDEMLFMYGDEVDFDIRVKKAGYKILALKNAVCWHMHVFLDKSGMRSGLAYFLFSRNMFILYRKHLSGIQRFLGYLAFLYMAKSEIAKMFKNRKFNVLKAYLHGAILGVLGYYKIPSLYQRQVRPLTIQSDKPRLL